MGLLAALVARSKAWADPLVADYTEGNRLYTVRITRPAGGPSYNRETGAFSNPEGTEVYTGPARLRPIAGGEEVTSADELADVGSVSVSINDDVVLPPQLEDLVEILDTPQSQAGRVARRVFVITDVSVGGFFTTGWQLTGTSLGRSRREVDPTR